jgi:hypothetical protein
MFELLNAESIKTPWGPGRIVKMQITSKLHPNSSITFGLCIEKYHIACLEVFGNADPRIEYCCQYSLLEELNRPTKEAL